MYKLTVSWQILSNNNYTYTFYFVLYIRDGQRFSHGHNK